MYVTAHLCVPQEPKVHNIIIISSSLIYLEQSSISQRSIGLHTHFLLGVALNQGFH